MSSSRQPPVEGEIQRQKSFNADLDLRLAQSKQSQEDGINAADHHNLRISNSPPVIPPLDAGDNDPIESTAPSLFPRGSNWSTYFHQEIAHNHFLEAQLIFLGMASGIGDAMSTTTFGIFFSKQTGNTILLALYAVRHQNVLGLEKNVGTSMGFFLLGAAVFGHFGHLVRQRRRLWLLFSNFLQTMLVVVAIILQYLAEVPDRGARTQTNAVALVIIALLSFASGGQISLAVCVKLPELNTVMVTGCLIQLVTDRKLFSLRNAARNRRFLFFVSLLIGAFIGAAATKFVGASMALLLVGVCKALVTLSFCFNHGMIKTQQESERTTMGSGCATPFEKVLWGD